MENIFNVNSTPGKLRPLPVGLEEQRQPLLGAEILCACLEVLTVSQIWDGHVSVRLNETLVLNADGRFQFATEAK